jgi:hypothetical protein
MDPRETLEKMIFGRAIRTVRDKRVDRRLVLGYLPTFFAKHPMEPKWDRIKAQLEEIRTEGPGIGEDLSRAAWVNNEIRRYLARLPSGLGLTFEAPCIAENLEASMNVRTSWGPALTNWQDERDVLELDTFIVGPYELAWTILYEGLLLSIPDIEAPSWAMPEWFSTDRHTYDAGCWAGGLQVIEFRHSGSREGWVKRPMEFEIVEGFEPPNPNEN